MWGGGAELSLAARSGRPEGEASSWPPGVANLSFPQALSFTVPVSNEAQGRQGPNKRRCSFEANLQFSTSRIHPALCLRVAPCPSGQPPLSAAVRSRDGASRTIRGMIRCAGRSGSIVTGESSEGGGGRWGEQPHVAVACLPNFLRLAAVRARAKVGQGPGQDSALCSSQGCHLRKDGFPARCGCTDPALRLGCC